MKYLINGDFVALRKGDFVSANEDAGEFILDTEKDEPTGAVLEGIADANSLALKHSAKVVEKRQQIFNQLAEMPLSEVNEMTDSAKVKQIVEDGKIDGKTDNDMLVEIVNSGVSFKAATKLFKQALEEGGYAINSKKRAELAAEKLVKSGFEPETYDDVKEMAELLVSGIPDTTNAQALAAIRKYAKEKGVELPKAPKGAAQPGVRGFRAKMFGWMVQNPGATMDQFTDFVVKENGKKEVLAKRFWPVFETARKMAEGIVNSSE